MSIGLLLDFIGTFSVPICNRRKIANLPHIILITTLLALTSACARKQSASVERLAILPFENLSSNAGLSWMGRAVAAAIAYDLTPSRVYAENVDSMVAAHPMNATRAVQGYFFE